MVTEISVPGEDGPTDVLSPFPARQPAAPEEVCVRNACVRSSFNLTDYVGANESELVHHVNCVPCASVVMYEGPQQIRVRAPLA